MNLKEWRYNNMKKIFIAVLIVMIVCLIAAISYGCRESSDFDEDFPLIIKKVSPTPTTRYMYLCYDKDTGVMYILSEPGVLTPLYNADGTLRIYEGE